MAVFQKFNSFVEAVAEGVHTLGTDQLVLGLTSAANAPDATDTSQTDITEIPYTNLSTRNLTNGTSAQAGGLYTLKVDDITLSASNGAVAAFQYIFVYNDTSAGKELVGFFDYGSELTLQDGESLLVDFDDANGLLTLQ